MSDNDRLFKKNCGTKIARKRLKNKMKNILRTNYYA